MKGRCLAILGILIFGLIPFPLHEAKAENALRFPMDDATSLMYISDGLLLDESDIDGQF